MEVLVTGAGLISAIGNNVEESIGSFREHRSGIGPVKFLQSVHRHEFPMGEVKMANEELAARLNVSPNHSRTTLLAYWALQQALEPFSLNSLKNLKVGLISGTSVGGMDLTESFFESYLQTPENLDLKKASYHDCGRHTDFMARQLGIFDYVSTLSTACSSSANAIMLGARMVKHGLLDVAIAGGVDALTKFTLNGFNTLMIVDREQCRPLDASRRGLNLGEGAAYLVLMNEKLAEKLSAEALCKISGYCNANDAHHQTALSEEGNGPYLAMAGALAKSKLKLEDISYINMHGTGTDNNDLSEGRAIQRLFGNIVPRLSSTKSFTGHTLGASGAIEAVFSSFALKHNYIFPNFSFKKEIEGLGLKPELRFSEVEKLGHVMSNSFGFGGNCSSIIFSAC